MEKTSRDGEMSWKEKLGLGGVILRLPIVIVFKLLTSPWSIALKTKTWRRALSDSFFQFLTVNLSVRQLQYGLGPTLVTYKKWSRSHRMEPVIEEIGEGARILWLGPKSTDRVILYFHGGGYLLPMQEYSPPFLQYLQLQLRERSIDVGIAILNYSLAPNAPFPTQLRQATAALGHVLKQGTDPAKVHLIGESAGGNLILQLLSHILHPLPSIPPAPSFTGPIGSASLLSPWVSYTPRGPSFVQNANKDWLNPGTLERWGVFIRAGIPDDQLAHAEPITAQPGWWAGVDKLVSRFLVTAGESECLQSSVTEFTDVFEESLSEGQLKLVVQKNGVHNDALLDFTAGQPTEGSLAPMIVDWFAEGPGR